MARKLRIHFEGAIYHVTVRGVERRAIFHDDADRERFLVQLADSVEHFGVRLFLYCLMSNHVHLLVETPQGNLGPFMQRLQTAYTVYFNLRHRRAGHLMQGRYGAQLVQGDQYLLNLSRYIHLNPVFTGGLVRAPVRERIQALRQYRWSSYRGYVGLAKPESYVDYAPIRSLLPRGKGTAGSLHRRFVESGIARTDEEFVSVLKESLWGIGDEAFRDRVRIAHDQAARVASRKEDVAFRGLGLRLGPEAVVAVVAQVFGVAESNLRERSYRQPARAVAMVALGKFAGLNQREVAAYLGVGTGSAVCRATARLSRQRAEDHLLDEKISAVEDLIRNEMASIKYQ